MGIPVNGIIGYNFFKNNLVEINYKKKRVVVFSDNTKIRKKIDKKYNIIPITIEKSKPYIKGSIVINNNEIPVKLLIDIGNSDAIWLFQNYSPLFFRFTCILNNFPLYLVHSDAAGLFGLRG